MTDATDSLDRRVREHLRESHVIERELRGGMSRVFVAQDVALQRRVVIKVLSPALAATVSVARFQREIMVAARMHHPNIVTVLTAGEVDGLPYFVMPYIDGESLRTRIARGPLSLRETVVILKDVMRALAYAHRAGIVHRDLKPDNILLAGSAAMVTDFGVAKAVTAARDRGVLRGDHHTITGVGISLGTPQYMAPEQAAADPNADHRVDLYAMGIVAYEMLVGSPPFHGRTPQALLAAQLTELPPPLASRRQGVTIALSEIVTRCLEKNPDDRPPSADEVVALLDSPDALGGPLAVTPGARRRRMRRMASRVTSGVAGVGIVALALAWALRPPTQDAAGVAVTADGPVQVVAPAAIGPESAALARAFGASIEAALVREGMPVRSGGVGNADAGEVVVETTVQRVGRRARAHVRVAGASSDDVWSDQLDFLVDSSFAAQDSVAARVVRAVRARRAARR